LRVGLDVKEILARPVFIGDLTRAAARGGAYRLTFFFAAMLALMLAMPLPGRIRSDPTAIAGGH
jgi:hypothetical protein